jgi:uncharacterized protein YpmB
VGCKEAGEVKVAPIRASVAYILIGLALILVVVGGLTLLYVVHLRSQVEASKTQAREACERGNVLREATKLNTVALAKMATIVGESAMNPEIRTEFQALVPELNRRADLPRIQEQPCLTLFPK